MRADVRARIRSGRIEVQNHGQGSARNIRLASALPDEPLPILEQDLASVFPFAELKPGERVALQGNIHMMTPMPFPVIVTWDDDSKAGRQAEIDLRIDDE